MKPWRLHLARLIEEEIYQELDAPFYAQDIEFDDENLDDWAILTLTDWSK